MALHVCARFLSGKAPPFPGNASGASCANWASSRFRYGPSFRELLGPILPQLPPPDQVWVSGITYIQTDEGWLYLAAVMDLHTRRILGWATADHMRTELVTEALQRARSTRAGADISATIAHSDRGSQYTSGDYRRALALLRMTQSMSRAANCYDNATMECCFAPTYGAHLLRRQPRGWLTRSVRLWASLKAEAFRSIPPGRAHARLLIHDYIDAFYNTRRLHSSLGFQSPLDFERTLNQTQN